MEKIYIIDDILLFNHGIHEQNVYQYKDLSEIKRRFCFVPEVCFVTGDIDSIHGVADKMKNIFMALRPLRIVLIDDRRTRSVTLFDLSMLMLKKNREKKDGQELLEAVRKRIARLEKGKMGGAYNPQGMPLYVKTTLSYGVQSGGMVAHSTGVLKGLERRFDRPVVYTTDYISNEIQKSEIHHISMKGYQDFGELSNMYFNFTAYREICEIQKEERPAFVYQRYMLDDFIGLSLAQKYKVPFVLEFNSSSIWTSRNWRGGRLKYEKTAERIEELNLAKADLVVCVSDELKSILTKRGIEEKKILVDCNGVDERKYTPDTDGSRIREKYGMGSRVVIGFSGSFGPFHGAERLAESYGRLIAENEEYREKTYLFFIGEGGTLPAVKRILKRCKVEDCSCCAGSVPFEEMPYYLAACDILVAPHVRNKDKSEFFGSPTKLFEYMAMGKAIAASDLNQIGKILKDNETALMFEPENMEEMKRVLVSLIEDSELRNRLGMNARREAADKYTWDKHVEKILSRLENR